MSRPFHEVVVGGVLMSPFVAYAAVALALFLVLRFALARLGFEQVVGAPPLALLCLYVIILALIVVAF